MCGWCHGMNDDNQIAFRFYIDRLLTIFIICDVPITYLLLQDHV